MSWITGRAQLPIRLWLQSSSFAAVLGGYALFVLANQQLLQLHRQRHHQQRVDAALVRLQAAPASVPRSRLLATVSSPDLQLDPVPRCPSATTTTLELGDQVVSCVTVWLAGRQQALRISEDIGAEKASERTLTLLLLAAAGVASLLTSALLRLVLREGLRPLQQFSSTLDAIGASNLKDERLSVTDQPPELQPIARAFNQLLDRLHGSWEHQRTFVNAVSHELRTPITLIGGYANRLQRRVDNLSEPQREQLELIHAEAARMGRLVSDLLEIARDDAGRLEVVREPVEAWEALVQVHQRLLPTLGPRLQLDQSAAPWPAVLGDGARLQQCLVNLIENAVKYAPVGTPIRLAISREDDRLVLHVLDQGSGVPEADRARIFERFARGSSAITRERPGSGIGLAVVKTLMERMGGEVRVADGPGGGADFQLLLPLSQPASSPSTPSSSSVFRR